MPKKLVLNPVSGSLDVISEVAISSAGSTPNSAGASIDANQNLTLQPADGTNPGIVSTSAQTIAGDKTFSGKILADGTIDVNATAGTDVLTIGAVNADIINIGSPASQVNLQGDVHILNTTNLDVTNSLITVNVGGPASSGAGSGVQVEEGGSVTGYEKVSGDRNSWILKAPNTAGIATITPGAGGITLNQSSHDPLSLAAVGSSPNANAASLSSQVLTLQPADATNPGVVTAGVQTFGGAKTFSADTTLSGNLVLTSTVNSSLTGANARIPSHTNSNVTFTNASLTSIASANNGGVTGGHTLCLTNATGAALTIVNNYGGAAAGEAIFTGGGGDVVIPDKSSFWLQYNSTVGAWLCTSAGKIQVGTLDSQTKSANGLVVNGKTLTLQSADASYPGLVTTGTQTFAGSKTFAALYCSSLASVGVATANNGKIALGSPDAFSRVQIWNYDTNSVLRLGSLGQDGDAPGDNSSEGAIFYGQNAQGDVMSSTTGDFGYARIKPMRFGLYNSKSNVADYIFRVDPTSLYFKDNSYVKTFEVTRSTGATTAGSIALSNLTASTVPYADSTKKLVSSAVTPTELGYVSGVTSSIQTQLNSKVTAVTDDISPTSFTLANNQAVAADVTGLAFSNATVRSFEALVSITISATSSLYETVSLRGIQKGASWSMSQTGVGDNSQIVFSITSSGQVQYTSGNYSGFTAGTIKFRASTLPT